MELTYRIKIKAKSGAVGSILVNDELLRHAGLDRLKLKESAFDNLKSFVTITSMEDVLRRAGYPEDLIPKNEHPMYVLSTKDLTYGAAVIACDDILDRVHDAVDSEEIYIIPSSIHECIVIPALAGDRSYLKSMIEEVNASEVGPSDVLSNNLYTHKRGETLAIAT